MSRNLTTLLCSLIVALYSIYGANTLHAQVQKDSVRIFFYQGRADLDMKLRSNKLELERLLDLCSSIEDTTLYYNNISIKGWTSPEGGISINGSLSKKRTDAIIEFLSTNVQKKINTIDVQFKGSDWNRLLDLVRRDKGIPFQAEAINIVEQLMILDEAEKYKYFDKIRTLHSGRIYAYLYQKVFPELRSTIIQFAKKRKPCSSVLMADTVYIHMTDTVYIPVKEIERDTIYVPVIANKRPFYMAIKTNLAYDALLIPNIGIEFYLEKKWSVSLNWMYAWWKSDRKHNYWRTYGGDFEIRRWLSKEPDTKPLSGHHLGVYAQMLTYDFELGGRGYLGDKWTYGCGVSYGYSLPLTSRLNMDFTLGLGYLGGIYKEYLPIDDHYVWQKTRRMNWFGPTKAEISLVWLIGRGNKNAQKGGIR